MQYPLKLVPDYDVDAYRSEKAMFIASSCSRVPFCKCEEAIIIAMTNVARATRR